MSIPAASLLHAEPLLTDCSRKLTFITPDIRYNSSASSCPSFRNAAITHRSITLRSTTSTRTSATSAPPCSSRRKSPRGFSFLSCLGTVLLVTARTGDESEYTEPPRLLVVRLSDLGLIGAAVLYPRDSSPTCRRQLGANMPCAISIDTAFSILVYCSPTPGGLATFWNTNIRRGPRHRRFPHQLMAYTVFRSNRTLPRSLPSLISLFLERRVRARSEYGVAGHGNFL